MIDSLISHFNEDNRSHTLIKINKRVITHLVYKKNLQTMVAGIFLLFLQGDSYVLARWFKCHLWPKFSMWVKFYDLFILIWFLRVYFVKKVFQWDLHSLRKMTTSYKILDVKKATLALYHKGLPCLQIGSKKNCC